MTHFEEAVLLACKAFIKHYEATPIHNTNNAVLNAPPKQNLAPRESNGIPICPVHDKAMKDGRYGYYCTSKAQGNEQGNKNGYCSYQVKA